MLPGLMGQRSALHYSCMPSSSARLLFLPRSIPASVPLCGRSYESVLAQGFVRRGEENRPLTSQPMTWWMKLLLLSHREQAVSWKSEGKSIQTSQTQLHSGSTRSHTAQKPNSQYGAQREEESVWFSKEKLHHCRVRAKTGEKPSLRNDKHKKHIP